MNKLLRILAAFAAFIICCVFDASALTVSCPPGYWFGGMWGENMDLTSCGMCGPGYACPGFTISYVPEYRYGRITCGPGTYSGIDKAVSCTDCPDGGTTSLDHDLIYGNQPAGLFVGPQECYKKVPMSNATGSGTQHYHYDWVFDENGNGGGFYIGNYLAPDPFDITYTSCEPGYYMTASSTSTACAPTPALDNACRPCSVYGTGYSCAGGTACPVYAQTCAAGYYWDGVACAQCTGANYCPGFSNVVNPAKNYGLNPCPTGYIANTTVGKTSASQCAIVCPTGTRVATIGARCTSPAGPWIGISNIPILYGHLSPIIHCMAGYNSTGTTATAHDNPSDCTMAVSGGMHVPSNLISARYVRLSSNGNSSNRQTHVAEIHAYSLNLGGTNYLEGVPAAAPATSPGGATDYNYDRSSHTNCGTGTPCVWDMGAVREIGSILFTMYSDGRVYENVTVQVSTDKSNWTTVFGPMNIQTTNQPTTRTELVWLSSGAKPCAAGSANAAHTEVLSVPTTCTSCVAGTYAGPGNSSCSACATGSYSASAGAGACTPCQNGTTTSATGQTSCNATCSNKNAYASSWTTATWSANTVANSCKISGCTAGYGSVSNAACATCAAGTASAAGALACTACTGATYSGATAATCSACPTGYTANTDSNKNSVTKCQISCGAGTRVAAPNASCTSPSGGWWTGAHLVNYNLISPVNYCTAGYTSSSTVASGHDASNDCIKAVPAGYAVPTQANPPVRYIKYTSNGSTANTGNHMIEIQAWSASNGTGTNYLAGIPATNGNPSNPAAATDGSWSRSAYTGCASTGCIWDIGSVKTVGSIKFALYTDGRTYHDVRIQISTDNVNWYTVLGPMEILTQNTSAPTGELVILVPDKVQCVAGTARAAHNLSIGSTSTCTVCTGATYADAAGLGACKTCPTASNATDVVSYNYYNTGKSGDHTVREGCYANFAPKTLTNGSMTTYHCYVDKDVTSYGIVATGKSCWVNTSELKCNSGYYNASANAGATQPSAATLDVLFNNACVAVGVGNWSAADALTRTACATGLTTIGYGTGADEAADCGRVLNYGSNKLYLRSVKKTTPSLVLSISGTKYYGNMSTATKGKLRINNGGTKYSVYDDSM